MQDDEPRGVTYLWNQAYRLFKASPQYEALFIVNNDIIFPNGTFTLMAQASMYHRTHCICVHDCHVPSCHCTAVECLEHHWSRALVGQ